MFISLTFLNYFFFYISLLLLLLLFLFVVLFSSIFTCIYKFQSFYYMLPCLTIKDYYFAHHLKKNREKTKQQVQSREKGRERKKMCTYTIHFLVVLSIAIIISHFIWITKKNLFLCLIYRNIHIITYNLYD